MKRCNFLLVLLAAVCSASGGKLPPDLQKCSKSKDTSQCLKTVIPAAMTLLADGYSPLGATPLEPLTIPAIKIEGTQGSVSLTEHSYKDLKIHNLTKLLESKDVKASVTPEGFTLDIDLFAPHIKTESQYRFQGRILLLPIDGNGDTYTNFGNVNIHIHLVAETIKKNGKDYYKVKEAEVTFDPENVMLHFDNLINGNEMLTAETNRILNENWKELAKDIKPVYEHSLSEFCEAYISNIFSKVAVNDLFTE